MGGWRLWGWTLWKVTGDSDARRRLIQWKVTDAPDARGNRKGGREERPTVESYRCLRRAWQPKRRKRGRANSGKLPVPQTRVATEKEEGRQRPVQRKVTGDSDARRRLIQRKVTGDSDARRRLIQWKVTDDSE